jgi:hypothetical protein
LGAEQIDQLKQVLEQVKFSDNLDQDTLDIITKKIDLVRDTLNDIGFILEKEAVDDKKLSEIKVEILRQLNDSPLYEGLSTDSVDKIADAIVKSADKHVLTSEDFDEEILTLLRKLSDEDLMKAAYTDADIEQVGFSVVRVHGPQAMTRGKEALMDIVRTPIGREEALNKAIERIRNDEELMLKYLLDYYEVGGESSDETDEEPESEEEAEPAEEEEVEPVE